LNKKDQKGGVLVRFGEKNPDDSETPFNTRYLDHCAPPAASMQPSIFGDEYSARYQTLWSLTDSPVLVYELDNNKQPGCLLEANRAACAMLGYDNRELSGLSVLRLVESKDTFHNLHARLNPDSVVIEEVELLAKSGKCKTVELRCRLLVSQDSMSVLAVAAPKPQDDALRMAMAVMDSALEAVAVLGQNGCIHTVNPTFGFITGYNAEEARGRSPEFLYDLSRNGKDCFKGIWTKLKDAGRWSGEIWSRRKDGEIYPQWLTLNEVNESGVVRYVALFQDLSEAKRTEARLRYLSQYDVLTGLPNRALLRDRLEQALARAKRNGNSVGLLCMDVDNFKTVNESLGHSVGDELLKGLSGRLESCLRKVDTVSRPGGDEFALVLGGVQEMDNAQLVASRVQQALSEPFMIDGNELYVSMSMGLSIYPTDSRDAESLLRNAEMAMYRAKEQARGSFRMFTMNMNQRVNRRLKMENHLRKAIERKEFRVHYQPRVEFSSGRVLGVEALVRWQRPEIGLVPPNEFIPLAEETGLIVPLGEWVLLKACHQARKWRESDQQDLKVSVNISARQLLWQHDVAFMVESALVSSGLPSEALELEMTESVIMHNVEGAISTMLRLKEMGVSLAMDDFGVGYSSLNYLRRFPLDVLKIDRSFVRGLPKEQNDAAIVSGIINMAHDLDLQIVAEGVENLEQYNFLREKGCCEMQGHFFSPAVEATEMGQLLQSGARLVVAE
jgi:diguanylate cyclase (GGDEF)-like protein/PAS domain S-box-containing protein